MKMTQRLIAFPALLATLAVLSAAPATAQTGAEYFHQGAQSFIAEDLNSAETAVRAGLESYPDDEALRELQRLIDEARQQQQQQQQQQGSNDQESSDDQQQEQEQGQQDQSEEQQGDQSESDQQESEDQQQEQEQQEQNPQEQEGEQSGDENEEQESEGTPQPEEIDPNRLSEADAERILQALANEEEQLLREVQKIKGRPRRVEKDW